MGERPFALDSAAASGVQELDEYVGTLRLLVARLIGSLGCETSLA